MNDDVTKKAEALILGRTAPDAAERLPVGTSKRVRGTDIEAIVTDDEDGFPWMRYRRGSNRWLADWEVITDRAAGHAG